MAQQSLQPRADGAAGAVEWTPPRTREEADQSILSLSNDIGLILAQLAEDQVSWCQRTGRAPADYGAWRRRALFAKVHKEGQLRESKRIRTQLSGSSAGADAVPMPHLDLIAELVPLCRHVVELWIEEGARADASVLDGALSALAAHLDRIPPAPITNGEGLAVHLRGIQERATVWETTSASDGLPASELNPA